MALASWLRGVRIPRGDTKPGKIQHFGANFEGTLFLETTTLRPYAKLRGRLCVETRFMLKFTGIHVQLEADLYLKFSSQNGRNVYRKRTCILENTIIRKNGDQLSPIRDDVVPPVPEGKDLIVVMLPVPELGNTSSRGEFAIENFIFALTAPGETLPAPFKNCYGSLTYKVVAYMRSIYGRYVQIAEKSLNFQGYHNIHGNEDLLKPIKIKRGLLDVSANVQAILSLENGGYLPEESVPFTMLVRNPGCIPLQITVFIAQKITYSVDGTKLSSCCRVDQVELYEGDPGEADICWRGTLTVPKNQCPSYHDKNPSFDIRYAIQFKVHVENHGTIKGTAQLTVATTRDSPDDIRTQMNSLQVPTGQPWQASTLERRGSSSSIRSENSYRASGGRSSSTSSAGGNHGGCSSAGYSHRKKASLPSYSQVNSPVRSIDSIHPPPAYDLDDLDLEDEQISIPVPSTSTSKASSQRGSIAEEE